MVDALAMLLPIASRFLAATSRPDSPCWKLIDCSWDMPLVDRLWRSSKNLCDVGVRDRAAACENELHCAVDGAHAVDPLCCKRCRVHGGRTGLRGHAEGVAARRRSRAAVGLAVPVETRHAG